MKKIVFITGASSGIGKACAIKYALEGNDLIITGRRKERLDELKNELESSYKIKVLVLAFDVQDKNAVFESINNVPAEWQQIDILINNAGLALGRDFFDEANLDDWETMLNTNVHGLLYVSKAILPFMILQKKGHIVNISSTAAKDVYEKGNVYCASKSAVEAISHAMRIDLLRHNIKVTAIFPGAAETEFSLVRFKGDEAKAGDVYKGIEALTPKDVAESIFYCTSLPNHVCINELVITCTQQADSFYFYKKS